MQEEVENRTLALIVSSAKLTERVLVNAVRKYLEYKRVGKQGKNGMSKVSPHGKQTIKELVEQNQGIEKTDIDKNDIGKFKRVARKYGLDYAVRKSPDEDKFIVFFKAHDGIAMNAALNEYK